MMRRTTRPVAALLAVAATAAALVSMAGSAQAGTDQAAALPNCTKVKSAYVGNGWYVNTPGYDATSGSHFTCNLQVGDANAAVRWLQESIRYCYDPLFTVDGSYGPATRDEVKRIQRDIGVVADGIYGPATRKAMDWRLYSPSLGRYSTGCYQAA